MSERPVTDFEAFKWFMEDARIEHDVLGIGGFLPAVQIRNLLHAVTFIFDDDGQYSNFSAVELA